MCVCEAEGRGSGGGGGGGVVAAVPWPRFHAHICRLRHPGARYQESLMSVKIFFRPWSRVY